MTDKDQMYDRINDSMIEDEDPTESKQRRQCLCWTLIVILITGFVVVILFVILNAQPGINNMHDINFYTILEEKNYLWKYTAVLKATMAVFTGSDIDWASKQFLRKLEEEEQREGAPYVEPSEKHGTKLIEEVAFSFSMINPNSIHISYSDNKDPLRWNVRDSGLYQDDKEDFAMRTKLVGFTPLQTDPFGWNIFDKQNDHMIVSTSKTSLRCFSNFLEIGFRLPRDRIFGGGEHTSSFLLEKGRYSMWAKDDSSIANVETGTGNMYGVHPFIMGQQQEKTKFFGLFFMNSNAQEFDLEFLTNNEAGITYRTTGGILDMYIFVNKGANEIIGLYNEIIGKPRLPPFWAMGFHQSSWYSSTAEIDTVINEMTKENIPFDSVWVEVEYLKDSKNFEVGWSGLKDWSKGIAEKNIKFVPVLESSISNSDNTYYNEGKSGDTFIKSYQNPSKGDGYLVGKSLPGSTVYLDYFQPKANELWSVGLEDLFDQTSFGGLWINRNEVTQLCGISTGECPGEQSGPLKCRSDIESILLKEDPEIEPKKEYYNLPFTPVTKLSQYKSPLTEKGISLDAYHYDEKAETKSDTNRVEFNTHNIYGTMQLKSTYDFWMKSESVKHKKPFIMSRSTFPGAGRYGYHWLGNNYQSWEYLKYSIAGIFDFNMFGMPLVGADICGFYKDQNRDGTYKDFDAELCARWYQLGAFYPFARSNRDKTNTDPQEIYELKKHNEEYFQAAKNAIVSRYSYLRYMYTILFEVEQKGGTLVRPLFFEFPHDDLTFIHTDSSFMIGTSLKISPVLEKGLKDTDTFKSYFPEGKWADMNSGEILTSKGQNFNLQSSFDHVNVHLREGEIIVFQDPHQKKDKIIDNTVELQKLVYSTLRILPDKHKFAKGSIYIDDGIGANNVEEELYMYFTLEYAQKSLRIQRAGGKELEFSDNIENILEILIYDAEDLKDTDFACYFTDDKLESRNLKTHYNEKEKILQIKPSSPTLIYDEIKLIQFGSSKNKDPNPCSSEYHVISEPIVDKNTVTIDIKEKTTEKPIRFIATVINTGMVNIKIDFIKSEQFKVPLTEEITNIDIDLDINNFIKYSQKDEVFFFTVHAFQDESLVYYSTKDLQFSFTEHFIRLTAKLNSSKRVFGLGQRSDTLWLGMDKIYTMWNMNQSDKETGMPPGRNSYGTHPAYFNQLKQNKNFIGVYNINAAAQDFILTDFDQDTLLVTHVMTGGVIDLYIMFEGNAEDMNTALRSLTGAPVMPPKWAFGWHQSRAGYNTTQDIREVYAGYFDNQIPLDSLWVDMDYMDNYMDFTVQEEPNEQYNFEDLDAQAQLWKEQGVSFVPVINAGISIASEAYKAGRDRGIFIDDPETGEPFIGMSWTGECAWPDFYYDSGTYIWWQQSLNSFKEILNFDGLWLNMNENTNFCDGVCDSKNTKWHMDLQDEMSYIPGNRDLQDQSLPLWATHKTGVQEADVHSLNGYLQSKDTDRYFEEELKQRTFALTRSSFIGSGRWGQLSLGENYSSEEFMKIATAGIYLANSFGFLMSGADVCGYYGDTTPELCTRWTQLAALQPFARNHNQKNAIDQEPFRFTEQAAGGKTYMEIQKEAITLRYKLLNYLYSEYITSLQDGDPLYMPIFFKFPENDLAYEEPEKNIMIGRALKHSPIYNEVSTDTFFFPAGIWCSVINGNCLSHSDKDTTHSLSGSIDQMHVHLHGGHAIPYTTFEGDSVQINVGSLSKQRIGLMVLFSQQSTTQGNLFFDDQNERTFEVTVKDYTPINHAEVVIIGQADPDNIHIIFSWTGPEITSLNLDQNMEIGVIYILNARELGLDKTPKSVKFMYTGGEDKPQYSYDNKKDMFVITNDSAKVTWGRSASIEIKQ